MTDRFSIIPQDTVVGCIVNDGKFGMIWRKIVKDRYFLHTEHSDDKSQQASHKLISYNQGQPMGIYTSFPVMNLTHIMLCGYAHYLASLGIDHNCVALAGKGSTKHLQYIQIAVSRDIYASSFSRFD
jgi:hypothetical protein